MIVRGENTSLCDLVGEVLEVIILDSSPVPVGLMDQLLAVLLHLLITVPSFKPVAEHVHVELLETGEVTVTTHHVHDSADLIHVFPQLIEPLEEQPLKVIKQLRPLSFQQLYILPCEFERGGLEVPVPRRTGKDEPEVNVHNVTLVIDEEVPVVAILDLEDVGEDAVPSQRLNEPLLRSVHLLLEDI